MPIDDDIKSIRFNIKIDEPSISPSDRDRSFLIGSMDTNHDLQNGKPLGNYLQYRVASYILRPYFYIEEILNIRGKEIKPIRTKATFLPGVDQEIAVIFDNSSYSIEIDGVQYDGLDKLTFPPEGKNFAFVYSVPTDSSMYITISNFRLEKYGESGK